MENSSLRARHTAATSICTGALPASLKTGVQNVSAVRARDLVKKRNGFSVTLIRHKKGEHI